MCEVPRTPEAILEEIKEKIDFGEVPIGMNLFEGETLEDGKKLLFIEFEGNGNTKKFRELRHKKPRWFRRREKEINDLIQKAMTEEDKDAYQETIRELTTAIEEFYWKIKTTLQS